MYFTHVCGEARAEYLPDQKSADDAIIQRALEILESRMRKHGDAFTAPSESVEFLTLRIGGLDREVFWVLFLNAQYKLICAEEVAMGTLAEVAGVYPREIVKRALHHNAAALILGHNHPSGTLEPSNADKVLTEKICNAASLMGISVLDHLIVSGSGGFSMAERGLM